MQQMNVVTPGELKTLLPFFYENRLNALIKGKPGIGKTDTMIASAMQWLKAKLPDKSEDNIRRENISLLIPVIMDPVDVKGLPFEVNSLAEFLPYGEMRRLLEAKEPHVCIIDDLGQAPEAVQAALMQLLLAREIGGKKISPFVRFVAATNRREDRAAVSGILSPVLSRFAGVFTLETSSKDWCLWALENNMPPELVAFIRLKPELLDGFSSENSRKNDMEPTSSPRTVAYLGSLQTAGIPAGLELQVFSGAAGSEFGVQYAEFLDSYKNLPSIDSIILDPDNAVIPSKPAHLFALVSGISRHFSDTTVAPLFRYLERLPVEFSALAVKDTVTLHDIAVRDGKRKAYDIARTKEFISWASRNSDIFAGV